MPHLRKKCAVGMGLLVERTLEGALRGLAAGGGNWGCSEVPGLTL